MDVDWRLFLPLLAVLALTMLLTGPGMWSEVWGHRVLEKLERLGRGRADPARPSEPPRDRDR
jgi:hypothetical protein